MSVPVTVDVSFERIADMFVGAIEGGSSYWCRDCILKEAPQYEPEPDQVGVVQYSHRQVYEGVFRYEVRTHDGDEFVIGPADIGAGLVVMATKYAEHFADLIGENDDATTADVFFQCVVMKEVIYG